MSYETIAAHSLQQIFDSTAPRWELNRTQGGQRAPARRFWVRSPFALPCLGSSRSLSSLGDDRLASLFPRARIEGHGAPLLPILTVS